MVEELTNEVDFTPDEGWARVRSGALRQAIRQYLDTVQGVASYRDEHVQFGGAGMRRQISDVLKM